MSQPRAKSTPGETTPLSVRLTLDRYSAKFLQRMAEHMGLSAPMKRGLVQSIAGYLDDSLRVELYLGRCSPEDLRVLDQLKRRGKPTLTLLDLVRLAALNGVNNAGARVTDLIERGLVLVRWTHAQETFSTQGLDPYSESLPVFLAAEVLEKLPALASYDAPLDDPGEPPAGAVRRGVPVRLLREIDLVLRWTADHPLDMTHTGELKITCLRRMRRDLAEYAPMIVEERLALVIHMARLAGAILYDEARQTGPLGLLGEELLEATPEDKLGWLFRAAASRQFDRFTLPYFAELRRDFERAPGRDFQGMMPAVGVDWPLIPSVLALLRPGEWRRVTDLVRFAGKDYPFLFFRAAASVDPALNPPEKPTEAQIELERRVLAGFIEEIAWPFGLVDWAIGAERSLLVRLTPLGAALLRDEPSAESAESSRDLPAGPALIVQPDFDAVAYAERMTLEDQLFVWTVGVPHAEDGDAVPVKRFHLARHAFLWALNHGLTLDDSLARLRRLCGRALPKNVETELREWAAALRRVTLYRGRDLMEFDRAESREAALAEMDDGVPVDERFLLARRASFVSAEVIDYDAAPPTSLRIEADGRIGLLPGSAADLAIISTLDRVALRDEDGWVLDEAKVRAAPVTGRGLAKALASRARALPSEVYSRLLGWSGSARPLTLTRLAVVEVKDPELRRALLESSATKQYIAEMLGPNHVGVALSDLDAFVAGLALLGLSAEIKF
ncbi:MAG: hypothetical protein C4523_04625 [Myxococcales bacterium]|nr:MAG: hypothetical protein C4523_04625 [Myxococcales bacterium]